jgi:hypothetical protein
MKMSQKLLNQKIFYLVCTGTIGETFPEQKIISKFQT